MLFETQQTPFPCDDDGDDSHDDKDGDDDNDEGEKANPCYFQPDWST